MIWTPTAMMMSAMRIVVVRSIFSRRSRNFLWLAIFSLAMIRAPEIASMRECKASEIIASEPEISPTITLKIASKKFVRINKYPAFTMTLLRVFSMMLF